MTTPQRYEAICKIFHEVSELEGEARALLLDSRCGEDRELRAEIERLLARDSATGGFLAAPVAGLLDGAAEAARFVGRRLGGFELVRVIAAGGMGIVFEAEQERPRRRVALKLMRFGLRADSQRRRFEIESELLARLNHPGIARVFEVGVQPFADGGSDGAIPYIAMELVEGARSLLDHADAERLDLRERVALFASIGDAVHHGHQRGVIHRDLKPSNLLVDAAGRIKVIDFGIARAAALDGDSESTRPGELLGTVAYMSPEQWDGGSADVDVRSDVYSLGVVLYEFLCGVPPCDLTGLSITQALARLRDARPARPSVHRRELRGDVETIVLKAIEREPARRYQSAAELADDLRRHLGHQPIHAAPASAWYRTAKYVRRHRLMVAASVLTMSGLAAGLVVALHGLREAETALEGEEQESRNAKRQARIADMTNDFLNHDLLRAADPDLHGRATPIGVLLDEAATHLAGRFKEEPLVASRIHRTIGATYGALGDYAPARRQFEAAIARFGELGALDDAARRSRLEIQLELAAAYEDLTLHDDALRLVSEIRPEVEHTFGARSFEIGSLLRVIGAVAHVQGRFKDALLTAREVLEIYEETDGADSPAAASARSDVAMNLKELRRFAEAEPLYLQSLEYKERTLGPDRVATLVDLNNLAVFYSEWGRLDLARQWFEKAIPRFDQVLKPDHTRTLELRGSYATTLSRLGRNDEAVTIFAEIVPRLRDQQSDYYEPVLMNALGWGHALKELRQFEESLDLLEVVRDDTEACLGKDHRIRLSAMRGIAKVHELDGRLEDARAVYEEVLALEAASDRVSETDHLMTTLDLAGWTLLELKAYDDAEPLLRKVFDGISRTCGERSGPPFTAATCLVRLYAATGRPELAAEWRKTAERCRP